MEFDYSLICFVWGQMFATAQRNLWLTNNVTEKRMKRVYELYL